MPRTIATNHGRSATRFLDPLSGVGEQGSVLMARKNSFHPNRRAGSYLNSCDAPNGEVSDAGASPRSLNRFVRRNL